MNETKNKIKDTNGSIPGQDHADRIGEGNGLDGNRWNEPTRYIIAFSHISSTFCDYVGRSAIPLVASAALLALLVDPAIRFLLVL